jgi:hypothetical protein
LTEDSSVSDDSCLSIGGPGFIDVENSNGVHRIVSGGASAHEGIILRTKSSRTVPSDCAVDASSVSAVNEQHIDDVLRVKFLVKSTSSRIMAGAFEASDASTSKVFSGDAPVDPSISHSDPYIAHADEILAYLRAFTANEGSPHTPFLHSPSKPLPIAAIRAVVRRAQDIFTREPRVLVVPDDARVFSDIHGNFKDLLIWHRLFWPDGVAALQGSVVWLGDYVDRGLNSVEVLLYMLAQKVASSFNLTIVPSLLATVLAGALFTLNASSN